MIQVRQNKRVQQEVAALEVAVKKGYSMYGTNRFVDALCTKMDELKLERIRWLTEDHSLLRIFYAPPLVANQVLALEDVIEQSDGCEGDAFWAFHRYCIDVQRKFQ